ncbi:Maf family protein [Dehalococcoidia bacterium]|nr:Maf family protein [Dehalococcoidia bacterium]
MKSNRSVPKALVLASASPRRADLLAWLDLPFEIVPSMVDENMPPHGIDVEERVQRLARDKAQAVADRYPGAIVLGADTLVALGLEILGKPTDSEDAVSTLQRLRGKEHKVVTAVAIIGPGIRGGVEAVTVTRVLFREYADEDIASYVASGDPLDKAGSYAIQNESFRPAAEVRGCLLSVVGLPLCQVENLLRVMGLNVKPAKTISIPGSCKARLQGCSLAPTVRWADDQDALDAG